MKPFVFLIFAVIAVALGEDQYSATTTPQPPYGNTLPPYRPYRPYRPISVEDELDSKPSKEKGDSKPSQEQGDSKEKGDSSQGQGDSKYSKEKEDSKENCKGTDCKSSHEKEPKPYCTYDLKQSCKHCKDKKCEICPYIYHPVIATCRDGYVSKEEEFSNCCELRKAVCKERRDCKFEREKEAQPYCTHDLKKDCPDCKDKHCSILCKTEHRPVIASCYEGYVWKEKEFSNCCELHKEICKGKECKFMHEKKIDPAPNQYY